MKWLSRLIPDKNQTKANVNYEFDDTDRKKSELVRAEKALKNVYLDIQKEKIDARREELEELRSKIQMKNLDDKINRMQDEFDFDDDDDEEEPQEEQSPEMLLLTGINTIMNKMGQKNQSQQDNLVRDSPTTPTQASGDMSDNEIKDFLSRLPSPTLSILKKKSDEQLTAEAKKQMPGITDNTIKRMITELRK